jgi:hypothetical protein
MKLLILKIQNSLNINNSWRLIVSCVLAAIAIFSPEEGREIFFTAISDAYIQVSTFVALTLAIFYGLETFLKIDTEIFLKNNSAWHVPIATFLGALPGCGGAIMVMTQYVKGRLGFGSVVAVLTATMGDAAFLLIAQKPYDALIIFMISMSVGILFGYLVELIHGKKFMMHEANSEAATPSDYKGFGAWKTPWILMIIPGVLLGLMAAFQVLEAFDLYLENFGVANFSLWFGCVGAFLSVFLWTINPMSGTYASNALSCSSQNEVLEKVTAETCFVTVWVIIGFLSYELGVFYTGVDLAQIFNAHKIWLPLMGVLVGLLPGCGPQILVTGLYLQGLIPFSAQIANAISNDGDALFPAIALAPRAAILATLYTAIPALLVSYGYFFLFE